MKRLVIRFDVDTHKCVQQGIPNLVSLGKKHKVKFTFFVNFGRSINRKEFIQKIFVTKKSEQTPHAHLSAMQKLGLKDYIVAAVLNPQISVVGKSEILAAIKTGHEVGLHGGKNHEVWNMKALSWNKKKIVNELQWGIHEMQKIDPTYQMTGFASPHWKGNRKIYRALKELGFLYISDLHTNRPVQRIDKTFALPNIPNNISGEPEGVGYIEWCRAMKMTDSDILKDFKRNLSKRNTLATMYDHPYYAGVQEIKLLEKMIVLAKSMDFKIVTLASILNK